jgi:GNAT superfamily N-acetyltransferase
MSGPAVTLRHAVSSDAAPLTRVINSAYLVEQFFVEGPRISEADVQLLLARGRFLIASDDGQVAGCVFVEPRGTSGYLGLLSVDPARQGRGLGTLLLDAGERQLARAGCSSIEIKVVSLRVELPPFYRRRGYVDSGVEPFVDPRATRPCEFHLMTKQVRRGLR